MPKYVFTLTTIPSKIDNLHFTIDSLLSQTLAPEKIIINIVKNYNFRMKNLEIAPEKIHALKEKYAGKNLEINFVDKDCGPGTKLLGTLNSSLFEGFDKSDTFIVLVDDDLVYKRYMLEDFDYNKQVHKHMKVASYYAYEYKNIRIAQGADGFFIQLDTLDKFLSYYNLIKDDEQINYHDDFYISYYFYLLSTDIRFIHPPYASLIYDEQPNTEIDALRNLTGKYHRINLTHYSHEVLEAMNKSGDFEFLKSASGNFQATN
jgi:hypothetical protein